MMPWLAVFGLVAFIIIGLAWACCIVGGAADDRMDDELDSAFTRARHGFDSRPHNRDQSYSNGCEKAGNVINHDTGVSDAAA